MPRWAKLDTAALAAATANPRSLDVLRKWRRGAAVAPAEAMQTRSSYAEWIAAIVAGALVPVAACGGTTDNAGASSTTDGGVLDGALSDAGADAYPAPAPLRPGFTRATCTAGGTPLSAFTATPPFDYVELRLEDGYQRDQPDAVLEKVGTICQNATNVAACTSALAAINRPVELSCSIPYPCSARYLATTRGDEVKALIRDKDDLGKLAAPIDGIDEALFVAGWERSVTCETASYRATADGFDLAYSYTTDRCTAGTSALHDVLLHITRDGVITQIEDKVTPLPDPGNTPCAAARRASDVAYSPASASSTDPAAWLASAAYLEAASVGTFARLARELAAHDAPSTLVQRAARAAREERGHARLLRTLARASGQRVERAPRVARIVRSLETIALENAVEGAARETWGAVVVAHQAERASTPELRAIFAAIASEEASHAELAADVASWLAPRLSAPARARVASAYGATVDALERAASRPIAEAVRAPLGLPSRAVARRLFTKARTLLLERTRAGLVDLPITSSSGTQVA